MTKPTTIEDILMDKFHISKDLSGRYFTNDWEDDVTEDFKEALAAIEAKVFNPNYPFYDNKYRLDVYDRKIINKRISYMESQNYPEGTPMRQELTMLRKVIAYENERLKEEHDEENE